MRRLSVAVIASVITSTLAASSALAQGEYALRTAFEGKTVTVKLDMPGTSRGVDVYPQEAIPVSFRDVADRTKDFTVSLKMGQQVMVTKIVVKRDLIEFQLGGGGYGTLFDNTGSNISASEAGESQRERALRDSVKTAPNAAKKKAFERELNDTRAARERENTQARAQAAQANELREVNLRAKRSVSGSRFNIRYKPNVPSDAMTPEGVMQALAAYVDFPGAPMTNAPMAAGNAGSQPAAGGSVLASVRQGLLLAEVEALLGPANTASESKEGVLTLMKRSYIRDGKKVVASFVNGVLIDYAIGPI
jgi:hypothetical protein